MTYSEFIQNRPDLLEKATKYQETQKVVSNLETISNKWDTIPEKLKKSGRIRHNKQLKPLLEDGKKVQYKIKIKSGKEKDLKRPRRAMAEESISISALKNYIKKPARMESGRWTREDLENSQIVYEVYVQNPYTGEYEFKEERQDVDVLINKLGY